MAQFLVEKSRHLPAEDGRFTSTISAAGEGPVPTCMWQMRPRSANTIASAHRRSCRTQAACSLSGQARVQRRLTNFGKGPSMSQQGYPQGVT